MTANTYDAICKSSQEEGITWFYMHCRISFNGVTKITTKINKIEQTQKEIMASVQQLQNKVSEESQASGVSKKVVEDMVREEFEEQKRIEDRKLNIMCFGIEESKSINLEARKKEDDNIVNDMIHEVLGEEEDCNFSKLIRIGRPIREENETDGIEGDQVGNAEYNDIGGSQVMRKRIRPIRLTFDNMEKKKKVLDAPRESINESRTGRYKYIFFQQDLTWKQRDNAKAKRAARAAVRGVENGQRIQRAQQGSRDQLFK